MFTRLLLAWSLMAICVTSHFSAVTYTTTGYGDVALPDAWKLLGAVEALTGILMCGWSTGFFFAVASRMFETTARRQANGSSDAHRRSP
jgi:hypothetical protein